MKLIDTHSHIYLEEFDADREAVVQRAREAGVQKVILPAIDFPTLNRVEQMCQTYPGFCFPLIGLHPTEVGANYQEELSKLRSKLESSTSFVGIGEVGLDLYWDTTFLQEQLDAFEQQIQWAIEYDLPLIIHSRSSQKELVETLSKYRSQNLRGIFHCFSGSSEDREQLLAFPGFLFGIGGTLTYKKSTLPDVVRDIPLDRLVVETDSPYLAPVPHRGKRNESSYVKDTVLRLSECLDLSVEEVSKVTSENAEKLFFESKKGQN